MTDLSRWSVEAWVQAPGEFPSWALEQVYVEAPDIGGAVKAARAKLALTGLGPVVVSVFRVHPAWRKPPS